MNTIFSTVQQTINALHTQGIITVIDNNIIKRITPIGATLIIATGFTVSTIRSLIK